MLISISHQLLGKSRTGIAACSSWSVWVSTALWMKWNKSIFLDLCTSLCFPQDHTRTCIPGHPGRIRVCCSDGDVDRDGGAPLKEEVVHLHLQLETNKFT